ncbi:MAG: biotin--[acetyl-CoA-carboxylase] ligase [Bacillota bacterium]|nr:biotin--[acetyl-CoA-carboxylase] ligase [Bacillota bacterium]
MKEGAIVNTDRDLELARDQVRGGLASVALAGGGVLLGRAGGNGLIPLVQLLARLGWEPARGGSAWPVAPALADRVVGRAAAVLAAQAGVKAVWGRTMSAPARDLLMERGVYVEAEEVVAFVWGRRRGEMCPMEGLVALAGDPADGSAILWAALGRSGRPPWVEEIGARLRSEPAGERVLGRLLLGYEECASTNDVLARLARRGYPEGTVVMARCQTAGRGRLGRRWESPPGGIWMSVLLRPPPELLCTGGVLLATASVAACRSLAGVVGLEAGIKWPNDVYWAGRKLGGVLAEVGAGHVVLGIGLNADFPLAALPVPEQERATTVLEATGGAPLPDLAASLLDHLDRAYREVRAEGPGALLREWRRRGTVLGEEVIVGGRETLTGVAEDIDEEGALLVRRPDGELVRVIAGDVSLRTVC